jgi:serine/threonine protein kinase
MGGDIKISDFGAALLSSGEQTRTQVSGIGSPAYMSPQQVREMPLNHQTDIYSLGVVMYQLLTGRLPFQASNNYSMVYQITHVDPPPPSDFRRDLPASLDAVVARAMQKDLERTLRQLGGVLPRPGPGLPQQAAEGARQRDFADSEKFETLRGLPFFAEFSDVETSGRWCASRAGTKSPPAP